MSEPAAGGRGEVLTVGEQVALGELVHGLEARGAGGLWRGWRGTPRTGSSGAAERSGGPVTGPSA